MSTAFATDLQDYQRREMAERVAATVDAVRRRGDATLHETLFPCGAGPALNGSIARHGRLRLTPAEADACIQGIPPATLADLRVTQEQARLSAEVRRAAISDFETDTVPGIRLGVRHLPVESVGICLPSDGGCQAALSAIAAAIAASAAGVQRIAACIGGQESGGSEPPRLSVAALALAGVEEIYRVDGVQGLAALSFGTESIPRAEIVLGVGEGPIEEAGRQLSVASRAGGAAGVLVIADDGADPELIAADLIAAGECGSQARGVLITTAPAVAARVATAVERQLRALPGARLPRHAWSRSRALHVVPNPEAACALANRHGFARVEVMTAEPRWFLERLRRCSELFLGAGTAASLAEILDGPAALRTVGDLAPTSIKTFLRTVTYLEADAVHSAGRAAALGRWLRANGLEAHARACELRAAREQRWLQQPALAALPLS